MTRRFPGTPVDYRAADLLNRGIELLSLERTSTPPMRWRAEFRRP